MTRVLAIGIDAGEWSYIEPMLDSGRLPNLARLRSAGSCHRLVDDLAYTHGLIYQQFLAGKQAALSSQWEGTVFDPRTYSTRQRVAGRPAGCPAFYEQVKGLRTVLFDVPWSSLEADPSVVQVIAWGAEAPMHPGAARPAGLLREIDRRIGPYPDYDAIYTVNWYDPARIDAMTDAAALGARRRAEATAMLQERFSDWDLFVVVMAETHRAGEFLWHGVDNTHPLAGAVDSHQAAESLERIYAAVDEAIGQMVADCPSDAAVVVFSLYGSCSSPGDVPSTVLLPELLHRLSGRAPALRSGDPERWKADGCPPVVPAPGDRWEAAIDRFWLGADAPGSASRRSLAHKVWNRRRSLIGRLANRLVPGAARDRHRVTRETRVRSRVIQAEGGPGLEWQSTERYRQWWPGMRAFALPSFADGMVRVNLTGREANGIVTPADYTLGATRSKRRCAPVRIRAPAFRPCATWSAPEGSTPPIPRAPMPT
jgi:hypothetical protein